MTNLQIETLSINNIKVAAPDAMLKLIKQFEESFTRGNKITAAREKFITENKEGKYKYTACDNSEGYCFCEDFTTFEAAVLWLTDQYE